MTEGTKALNSSVSTLKKNPGRIGRLVKAAKLLIVPPKQYATGKAKEALDAAVKKLKAKRGLNGVVGEGAGPFSDKALQKSAGELEKKAVDKKTQDRALAASGVASGAALGGALTHDAKKSRITSRMGTKGAYKHMGDSSIDGAEKRLANSAKTLRRMGKPLRRAGIKGAAVGGLVGAALGAAHLKKEAAAVPAVVPKQQFLGKGKIPAGAKDVSPKAVLKHKAGKAGKIAAGLAAGAVLVGAAKKHMEKKAEKKKDSNVAGAAIGAGSVAYTARSTKDSIKGMKGVHKQYTHLLSKGHAPSPIDYQMALKTLDKPIARRAAKAGLKAGVAGALAGAAYDRLKGHKKQAAEKIQHEGKTVRRGTVSSAAGTMGGVAGALTALKYRKNPKGMLKDVAQSVMAAGSAGGTYGVARKGLRTARGEKSMNPREFDKVKKLQKSAAEMIERNGKKYRKGTAVSAAQTMTGVNAGMQIAGNMSSVAAAKKMGVPVSRAAYLHKVPAAAVGGAIMGYGYGKIREHFRKKRGEESLNHADFKAKKAA